MISPVADPTVVEILGAEGVKFYVVDLEHGLVADDACDRFIRACEDSRVVPLARVPPTEPDRMTRLLDAGLGGIVVPRVDSARQVSEVLNAIRFPPHGRRGMAATRVSRHGRINTNAAFLRDLENRVLIAVQIETEAALGDLSNIASLERLDALIVGTRDLSISLGIAADYAHPAIVQAVDRIRAASREVGMNFGMLARDPGHAAELQRSGPVLVLLGLAQIVVHGIRAYFSRA